MKPGPHQPATTGRDRAGPKATTSEPRLGDLLLSVGAAIALGILFLTVWSLLPGVAVQP
jgi:hypothetical protein